MSETESTPRVLIVDDSRIVRASLIKHIRGRFEFREAADGEGAWEIIMLDPSIKVVISDLTMPKLDGYGLLERMRSSKLARIQTLPFIMLSGTDNIAERDRAIERGATDMFSKGIGASELISRLDIMLRLSDTQRQLVNSQEQLAQSAMVDAKTGLSTPQLFTLEAEKMLAYAHRHGADLSVIVLKVDPVAPAVDLAALLTQPIASLLKQAVRKEDAVSLTGELQFVIAAQAISQEAAMSFATRLLAAIAQARVVHQGEPLSISASVGVASLIEDGSPSVEGLQATAIRRAERAQRLGGNRVLGLEHDLETTMDIVPPAIALEDALAMLANGELEALRPHLPQLKARLKPLLELLNSA
jgi:two-component system cell cycle response regulator